MSFLEMPNRHSLVEIKYALSTNPGDVALLRLYIYLIISVIDAKAQKRLRIT